jgi:hypothetical protein
MLRQSGSHKSQSKSYIGQWPWNRGEMGAYAHHFFKSEKSALSSGLKCPFFWAKVPHLKNKKNSWMNAFCSSKDSVQCKGYFRRYRDSIFSKIFVRLVNNIRLFDFGHIQKCLFWPMFLHFRNGSAASNIGSVKYGHAHISLWLLFR